MRIALAGNPNCGKTTIYNALTGKNEQVGNWAGVTVASKEAPLKSKFGNESTIVDLPGAYSITPFTGEEGITRDFIIGEKPDVIINIIDGANIERSLLFTSQLLELGIPMVVALNKADIIEKRKDIISVDSLSNALGVKIVETTATSEKGLQNLINVATTSKISPKKLGEFKSDEERQIFVENLLKSHKNKGTDLSKARFSDKLDRIFAHKFFGLPIFFLIIWAIYSVSIQGVGLFFSDYINEELFGSIVPEMVTGFLESMGANEFWMGFIVDGVVAGIGAVLGFLPLIMTLFFFLALLEDSGYMARVAVLMDRYFKKIGLSGKSVIPMIVGTGCSIPGIMATRTIENESERRLTAILSPLVPCGAKIPVITLFAMVFFPDNSWIAPSTYILSFVLIMLSGLLLKHMYVKEYQSTFILELPDYKIPSIKHAIVQMFDKAWAFISKAFTIILLVTIGIWFMQAYSPSLEMVEDQSQSILALVGQFLVPILIPLGIVSWQLTTAAITGFIAKETVVTTLAVLFAAQSEEAADLAPMLSEVLTPVTAYAYLAFNLFIPPCVAAIGAMNSEITDKKWLIRGIVFQMLLGLNVAIIIAQFGSIILYGAPATGLIPAIIVLIATAALSVYLIRKNKRELV